MSEAVVPIHFGAGGSPLPAPETLLLIGIEIVNAEGVVILRTIWATSADRRGGHRRTDTETLPDHAALSTRLAELTAAICWDPATPILAVRQALLRGDDFRHHHAKI